VIRFRLDEITAGAVILAAPFAWAEDVPEAARAADVVFLGELHDNPAHHARQAAWVAALDPGALVFAMITPEAARGLSQEQLDDAATLESALSWEASGWPDFDMYFPIFEAAPEARIFGAALPRTALNGLIEGTFEGAFTTSDVARFALDQPLPADEQRRREALQAEAHCNALPEELLPGMVLVQRARDARLAAAAAEALSQGFAPVVVITGNGHARRDWGAPAALALAQPDVAIFSLGQSEAGVLPPGRFDAIADAPLVARGDPCDAFR
jgi:uncharacterized iron-regulated protein